jgi:hypothetical protein
MGRRHPQLYVESQYGVDIAALLQVLEALGVSAIHSLPSVEKACYVIIDIERRRERLINWVDAWYEARTELNVRATLIGLVTGGDAAPVPGAFQIKAWNAVPGVLQALARIPRAISLEDLEHQRQSSRQRQAVRVVHDLRFLVELPVLNREAARRALMTTWGHVTHGDLKAILEILMDEVGETMTPALLRDILKRQLTTLEDAR